MYKLLVKLKIYGMKRFLIYTILEIYRKIWLEHVIFSYSQNREDIIIRKLLKNKKIGFYVDIGANDPVRFNNTKSFYLKGWCGINIEPNIDCFNKINEDRKRDINLNIGIGQTNSNITFYKFMPNTLSTFSKKEADKYQSQGYILSTKKIIKTKKLTDVLRQYLKGRKIDFMSIDTEGYDMQVLLSNNWFKYRPTIICIETAEHTTKTKIKNKYLNKYLSKIGYRRYINNGVNSIYQDIKKKKY